MDALTLVLAATAVAGLYMAWNIGANDVANAMGTSVGSGALSLRTALIIAAVFELAGALLAGDAVSTTIAEGIVDTPSLGVSPVLLAGGMACSLIAASIWIHGATAYGYPVSTTHSIVGAVLGFGLACNGASHVHWDVLGTVVASWVLSPLLGGVGAFVLYRVVQQSVFERPSVDSAARLFAATAASAFAAGAAAYAFYDLDALPTLLHAQAGGMHFAVILVLSLVFAATFATLARFRMSADESAGKPPRARAESVFAGLQVLSACFIAFAHGSNDVANAAGPVAAAFRALSGSTAEPTIPTNVLMIGACGIVLGLSTYGLRVMATIGREITQLTPSKGFAAETSAALTIVACSALALPVSTTAVLIGAVVGVGLHRTLDAINLRVLRSIALSWLLSVPTAALLSAVLTLLLRMVISE
ncbi:MAG: inorganic phosphate transporter [Myxococcota bacterium]